MTDEEYEREDYECKRCHISMALPDITYDRVDYCSNCAQEVIEEQRSEILWLKEENEKCQDVIENLIKRDTEKGSRILTLRGLLERSVEQMNFLFSSHDCNGNPICKSCETYDIDLDYCNHAPDCEYANLIRDIEAACGENKTKMQAEKNWCVLRDEKGYAVIDMENDRQIVCRINDELTLEQQDAVANFIADMACASQTPENETQNSECIINETKAHASFQTKLPANATVEEPFDIEKLKENMKNAIEADRETILDLAKDFNADLADETQGKWEPIETAPKNAEDITVRMADGTVIEKVHYACDMSGGDQPPYKGWFTGVHDDDGKFLYYREIKPVEWLPQEKGENE